MSMSRVVGDGEGGGDRQFNRAHEGVARHTIVVAQGRSVMDISGVHGYFNPHSMN